MPTISDSSHTSQAYAKQNNAAVQQTDNQAGESSTVSKASSAHEPKDSSEISLFDSFDNEGETVAGHGDYGYEETVSDEDYDADEIIEYADPDGEEAAEAAKAAAGQASEDMGLEGASAAGEIETAFEAGAVDAEEMSVGKIGDEYFQSPEYLERIEKLIEKQKNCKILYQSLKNDDQRAYVSSHRKNYIQGKDLYDIMVEKDDRFNSKEEAKAYVDARLEEVQEQYTGRAAGCVSALTVQEIAAEYDVKLPYGHPHVEGGLAKNIDPCVLSDCCLYSSWAMDKGSEDDMYWMNVKQLRGYDRDDPNYKNTEVRIDKLCTKNYSELRPGDSLTKGADHAMYILYNDEDAVFINEKRPNKPEHGRIIVAEASTETKGLIIREMSYDEAKRRGYTGVVSDSVYDGTAACYNDELEHH